MGGREGSLALLVSVPCVLFEDEDLLAVNKPAGLNTHAPSPHSGEGIYEWLRDREPRWAALAIIHRLDTETSGVLVFGKTTRANRSLPAQFTGPTVKNTYRCWAGQRGALDGTTGGWGPGRGGALPTATPKIRLAPQLEVDEASHRRPTRRSASGTRSSGACRSPRRR